MVFRGIAGLQVVKLRHRDGAIREIGGKLSVSGVSDELVGTVVVMAGFEVRFSISSLYLTVHWIQNEMLMMYNGNRIS